MTARQTDPRRQSARRSESPPATCGAIRRGVRGAAPTEPERQPRAWRQCTATRGAALVTAIILLVVMATMTATVLGMRANELAAGADAIHRLRVEAATLGGLHLAAWHLERNSELQQVLAAAAQQQGKIRATPAQPPIEFTGQLAGVSFSVEVWPRTEEARLCAKATTAGVYHTRWSRLPVTWQEDRRGEGQRQEHAAQRGSRGR